MKTANFSQMTPLLALKLVMVAALWGGTFIAGRVLAQSLPLTIAAFGRFFVASILLVIVAVKMEGKLPRLNREQMFLTAALGFTGIFLYNICFFGALARVPAGRTSLFVSLTPIVTAVLAGLIFSERLGLRRWMGIVVALFGAMVVITRGDLISSFTDIGQSLGLGEFMMLGAVFSWAAYTLISRKVLETLSPIIASTYGILWGFAFLSIGAIREFKDIDWMLLDWRVWTSVFYLGAFGTVLAFVWYYQGIQAVGPSRTAIFTNLVPAFGVLFSATLLGEPILISMVVGGLIAVLGVSLVNKK
ncbi:DMT family transporter [Polynucleobacter sp. AP-Latsch-80-C2]|jgi:drug/metabolite transporter (DMT)-like permease|uniref:DMT family transporter n=1 Tax=Polynucleobacter sp. AP-Latsch-80-C2 TaxID=2576931 RepID=UPI001C0C7E42|nr:DMT family transporter [Polynucleobacter sp. AP-Latsch-80-C2]MBU3622711.1 DMT family transporter [Polynucleobacter sp. AP-Latsch-80-C2]